MHLNSALVVGGRHLRHTPQASVERSKSGFSDLNILSVTPFHSGVVISLCLIAALTTDCVWNALENMCALSGFEDICVVPTSLGPFQEA